MPIYLDNAATTHVDEQVVRFVDRLYKQKLGNASSQHRKGIQAAMIVENARQIIAKEINAQSDEIAFFSGGTEINNTVIKGVASARRRMGNHIVVSAIEHPSILESVRQLEKHGVKISYVGVNAEGLVNPSDVCKMITPQTILVSIMHVNNEIGTIQPIRDIGRFCRRRKVYFHTDACQSFTKVPMDVKKDFLDVVTLNSHKIHGPKGVGALYVRKGVEVDALMHGGGQEYRMRAGTCNTEGVAGFGMAVKIADARDVLTMSRLRDYMIGQVKANISGAFLNGSSVNRVCNNVNFSFEGVDGKTLFLMLNKKNIFVSTASACASNSLTVSHVLQALKKDPDLAKGAIRMTLCKWTTRKEIDAVVQCLKLFVTKLRRSV